MKNEKLTGIGASFKAGSELADMMGVSKFELAFDLSTDVIGFTADIVETDGTVIVKGGMSINNTFDGDKLTKTTLNVDITAPQSDYEHEYDDEKYESTDIRIEGTATVKCNLTVDYSKFENGEFMTLNGSFTSKYDKAYVWTETYDEVEDWYSSSYEYSAEYTNKYCGAAETLNFNANATAKDGKTYTLDGSVKGTSNGIYGEVTLDADVTVDGKAVDGTFSATMKSEGETQTVSATVVADFASAPDFVAAPAAVQQARQAALNEYNQYN
jgi:hypothetical protein